MSRQTMTMIIPILKRHTLHRNPNPNHGITQPGLSLLHTVKVHLSMGMNAELFLFSRRGNNFLSPSLVVTDHEHMSRFTGYCFLITFLLLLCTMTNRCQTDSLIGDSFAINTSFLQQTKQTLRPTATGYKQQSTQQCNISGLAKSSAQHPETR